MMHNSSSASAAPSPKVLKKLEKEITKNSKIDEQGVHSAIKELQSVEKEHIKAHKAASKTKEALKKAENKEVTTAKILHEAEQKHSMAVAEMKNIQQANEIDDEKAFKLSHQVEQKRQRVETLLQEQAQKTGVRNESLSQIRSGEVPDVMPA